MFTPYSGAMARKSKLLAALDAYKGRNHELVKQKKLQKQAEKRKNSRATEDKLDGEGDENVKPGLKDDSSRLADESDGWESSVSEEAAADVVHHNLVSCVKICSSNVFRLILRG